MAEKILKFWVVWNPMGNNPRFRHFSKESAQIEAKRLAEENTSQEFLVLKVVDGYRAERPKVKRLSPTLQMEIPF